MSSGDGSPIRKAMPGAFPRASAGPPAGVPGRPQPAAPVGDPAPGSDRPSWRVDRRLTVLKAAGTLLCVLAALWTLDDLPRLVVAALAAAVLAVVTVRDLVAPVRLAADGDGITVLTGFAGRRHLPWAGIERIRLDERRRLGIRAELVEIDAGDNLYLFSGYQLGQPCEDVVATLRALRTGR